MRKGILESRKAAMEMSVGTIVTIVLLVSVLILGIFLISRIRESAINVIDMTDEAVTDQINQLFTEDTRVVIYPTTHIAKVEQGEIGGIAFGIKNLINAQTFSYKIEALDSPECGLTTEQLESWIVSSKTESEIGIASGEGVNRRVRIRVPVGSPLCLASYRIQVFHDGTNNYASEIFDIEIEPA